MVLQQVPVTASMEAIAVVATVVVLAAPVATRCGEFLPPSTLLSDLARCLAL